MIIEYLTSEIQPKCLEIGRAEPRPNWLCTDLAPTRPDVVQMDATQPFPLPPESFDFVFSEHMIEHITLAQGQFMLKECFRVLKPGGVCRIVTPSIEFLFDMWSMRNRDYVTWSASQFCAVAEPVLQRTAVFNNFVRAWGHTFIHDNESLSCLLRLAGFTKVRHERILMSEHGPLCGLESVQRMPDGFLAFESLILEATKE